MKPRLLTTRRAEYIPAPYFGKNESGCTPIGDRVLVRPDIAASSSGNIELPQEVQDRAQLAGGTGVLIARGDDAFFWNTDRTKLWGGYRPSEGDRVYFERYAGKVILGDDGVEYRLMDDTCIGGVQKKKESA